MWWIYLVIALAVVVAAGIIAFTAPALRRRSQTTPPPLASAPPPGAPPAPPAPPPADVVEGPVEAPVGEPPVLAPDDVVTAPDAPVIEAAPELERPAPAAGRLHRLRARLARSQSTLGRGLLALLSRDTLDDETWTDVEDLLLTADVGVAPSAEIVAALRTRAQVLGRLEPDELRALLREELLSVVSVEASRELSTSRADGRPAVVLVVGVNGTGKTTTCGKIARLLVAEGRKVVLGAADTFRAAAVDQLATWGARVGAETVRGPEGGDPASVAFDAVARGIADGADTVLIDTAGRLHTKTGLMDELGKVKRVIEKHGAVDEVLLVLDATTGQNGLIQARVFAEVVDITGIALTKLDGTAKGGIVIAVQRELGVPVKLVGLGEGPDDLAPFDAAEFVDALLGE